MKQITVLALIIGMVLGLFGCKATPESAQSQAPEVTAFSVGYARADITPEFSVPLQGYGNVDTRMSTGFLDRIYATCVAISDANNETVLMFSFDMAAADPDLVDLIRLSVSAQTGISQDRIMVTASHSHSAPAIGNASVEIQAKYDRQLVVWMTQAAQQALADRKEAQMYIGSVEIQGQSFIRHYQLEDGTSAGYESMASGKAVAHQGIGDYTMQLIRFTRDGGKDVLLSNWQCHPHRTGGSSRYDISADIVGALRTRLESQLDCHFAYYQGAAGNMNPTSLVSSEAVADDYREQGRQIAQFVLDAGDGIYTQVQTGDVQILHREFEAKIDHSDDHLLTYALEVQAVWKATNNRAQADALGNPNGIRSPYHAGRIVANQKLGTSEMMELNAISFGDVAIITAGYEMFAGNGLYIKENSPFKMTFIMGYANEQMNYIPSIDSFEYEAYENDNTRYEPGTGEQLADAFVELLKQLKQTQE